MPVEPECQQQQKPNNDVPQPSDGILYQKSASAVVTVPEVAASSAEEAFSTYENKRKHTPFTTYELFGGYGAESQWGQATEPWPGG